MTKIILTVTLFVCSLLSAQTKYDDGMKKAFQLWGEGKNSEASALFERIASAEKNNWLPNYYVALVNTTASFQIKDKETISALLTKAQSSLDIELDKDANNVELMVMQALIYTAWIVYDPMGNGMKYSPKVMEIYTKAAIIAPENPRVVFGKADFEIGGAQFFGNDTKPMCDEVDRAIVLFGKFKSDVPYFPSWGLDRALETQKTCKK